MSRKNSETQQPKAVQESLHFKKTWWDDPTTRMKKKTCVTRGVWGYSGLLHGALSGTQEFYSYLDPTVLLPTSLLQSAFWKTGSAESIALPKITPPSASAVLMQRLVCVGRRISTLLASTQDTSERPAHLQHNN